MWDIVILVALCVIALICVLAILLVVRGIVKDKKEINAMELNKVKVQAEITKQVYEEPIEKIEPIATAQQDAETAVTFAAGDKGQTLEDKYLALEDDMKKRYDEINSYASAVEGGKRFKNLRYEEFKIGSLRIVRMLIKRGVIVCEFMMQNSNFKSYVAENKISVKQSATVIKVTDDTAVQTIKDTIDIVVKAIAEEREFKKQLAREKRRAKRQEQE